MHKAWSGVAAILVLLLIFNLKDYQKNNTFNLINQFQAEAFIKFEQWLLDNAVKYRNDQEKSYRFGIFKENFQFVQNHNKRYDQGLETFTVQLNKFADIQNQEYKAIYLGYKPKTKRIGITNKCLGQVKIETNLPSSVDWVANKGVASVKNQGNCGSCWAFSACGAVQGLHSIQKKTLVDFSPQQLVDCSTKKDYGNEGCNGGQMDAAFWYHIDNGVALQKDYKYAGKDQKCAYTTKMSAFKYGNCAEVPANNTIALMSAVYAQPVAIAVEADTLQFQFYKKGVFSGKCGTDLDHGIVLTGYGEEDGKLYWSCKNSWGPSWGQNGYIRILRSAKDSPDGPGQCGIQMQNAVPMV